MIKRTRRLLCLGLFVGWSLNGFAEALTPVDNLTAAYRNYAFSYTNASATATVPAMVGIGSGRWLKSAPPAGLVNWNTTIGVPMTAVPANIMLGEKLEAPSTWSGAAPTIKTGTDGKVVWVDYAKTVIAIKAGTVQIDWPLTGGGTNVQVGVVSASPAKRPVRLYWTHQRPSNVDDTGYELLQNAGPTVVFGSNYRVDLIGTKDEFGGIEIWDEVNEVVGDVRLKGNELQAFEGAEGTFLILYSRFDESTNEQVLLAYELVTVMKPMQTLLNVSIGGQLRPISRSFETSELFPRVTRGLTDESDADEIYVYQHGAGAQKNYLWAIRDSSNDPWKIEVFWRAKEELDVIWPFEVDIYAASWDKTGAQRYLRDCGEQTKGDAEVYPKVFFPSTMTVTAMDFQVPKTHVVVEEGAFYTTYGGDDAYALLKYTSGDAVWFQTIHAVAAGRRAEFAATLGQEVTPPGYDGEGFFYPGWIRHTKKGTAKYPVFDPYNTQVYTFPQAYANTNSVYAPIFPVNIGQLDIWWSEGSTLNGSQAVETGHVGPLSSPMYFPTSAGLYTVAPPVESYRWDNGVPQIVIASGRGSAGYAMSDYDPWVASPSIRFGQNWTLGDVPQLITCAIRQDEAPAGVTTNFSLEAQFATFTWQYDEAHPIEIPWASFYGENPAMPYLRVGFDVHANLYLDGEKVTSFTNLPYEVFANLSEDRPLVEFHLALVHDATSNFTWYVNGQRAAVIPETNGVVRAMGVKGDELRLFQPDEEGYNYVGYMSNFRLWSKARSWRDINRNRHVGVDAETTLLVQFKDQENIDPTDHSNQWSVTGRLNDSSFYGNHGRIGYDRGTVGDLISCGLYSGAPLKAREGLVFDSSAEIYRQPDRTKPGYNPNEEHALMIDGAAHALRCDLNVTTVTNLSVTEGQFTSLPYVLVQYADPDRPGKVGMAALRVVPENDMYRFETFLDAGQMIQAPDPLARLQPANLHKFVSGPLYGDTEECFKDRKGWYWAHQAGNDGNTTNYVFEFSYPSQPSFDFPEGVVPPPVGEPVKWMENYKQRNDGYLGTESSFPVRATNDVDGVDYRFIVRWPDNVPQLFVNETLFDAVHGLPAVNGQLSVKIAYQQSQHTVSRPSVRLIDPTRIQYGSLTNIPDGVNWYENLKTGRRHFDDLPPYLRDRFVWNPYAVHDLAHGDTRELELSGVYINEVGIDNYLWLNVLDSGMKATITDAAIFPGGNQQDWVEAVSNMTSEVFELVDDITPFDSAALTTTGRGAGYVTLVMNDSTNRNMVATSESVFMYVIKVEPELYQGTLHPILSDNPLDKKVNMKYTADFNGTPELWAFEWMYAEPESNGKAPALPDKEPSKWKLLSTGLRPGAPISDWVTIGDEGVFGLSDHYVTCRYRALDTNVTATVGTNWTGWCAGQLAEGWVKRVLKAVNPFEQRCMEYANKAYEQGLNTELSMLQQAGQPYDGDVPLNQKALDDYGLIQIYETVLNQARKLSIDSGNHDALGSLALALQMAAGRISELYMALGNEALADAMNPTVDLGNDSSVADGAESSIFPFMNQCENLLDEELCLLRGRDLSFDYSYAVTNSVEPWASPYYNRLIWNFSSDVMGGQVAYVLNYGINDLKGDNNGMTDVNDAIALYPQGHGDAYGHYLSAVKGYYSLLRHPAFGWPTQVESILAYGGSVPITISYFHEKRFALAAAAKARAAEMIVSRTARWNYEAGDEDAWKKAEDTAPNRNWGNDEWATRGHLGAYYDWLVANAVLPASSNEDTGMLQMIDRESTLEIGEIARYAKRIQQTSDSADAGLNPLGLSDAAVPFDISPSEIDAGKTHFEQVFDRAKRATAVAHSIFTRVKGCANALRDQNEERDFETMVADEEAAINRELVEIYGTPYDEDIGPGKTYEQGYTGPDLYHYHYIETYDFDQSNTNAVKGRYMDLVVENYSLTTTNVVGTYEAEFEKDVSAGGALGNLLSGAITFVNGAISKVTDKVNPWLKYVGVTNNVDDYVKIPAVFIDTGADTLDGKVDYNFTVAAWSNTSFNASYFVGVDGFTPKPANFTSQRRAEGSLQIALTGYSEQLAIIEQEQANVKAAIVDVRKDIEAINAKDVETQMGYVITAATNEVANYYAAVKKNAETIANLLEKSKDLKSILTLAGVEAIPKIEGLSFDLTSVARGALYLLQEGLERELNSQIDEQKNVAEKVKTEAEKLQENLAKQYKEYQDNEERKKEIAAIQEKASKLTAAVSKLEAACNAANAQRMKYAQLLEKGRQLQNERARLRVAWASDLSTRRYRNMFYQILRNDELQRYNEAFESAAKYVFLAAKAYDYETGLLQSDAKNAAGREFMSQIVKARALGRFTSEGDPLGGGSAGDPGLADILYRMNENWQVLKGRLGFNNPQNELDGFSLRRELFRKNADSEGDAAWKDLLQSYWVEDLKSHPAFARLAQPFDPMQTKEPGFAIPFRTVIAARTGFFGNELVEGDNAFSSTYFATKIRGVGVWLEGEKGRVANRPEVYLIPAGLDYMRVPVRSSSSEAAEVRAWDVVDQVLPIPYPFSDAQWQSTDWSMMKDIFGNELCTQRRHPTIRAAVAPTFDESGMSYNARLIGRSVWNDQWWLIIPAASLHSVDATARENFVNAVRDIHLYFKTYSFSGN